LVEPSDRKSELELPNSGKRGEKVRSEVKKHLEKRKGCRKRWSFNVARVVAIPSGGKTCPFRKNGLGTTKPHKTKKNTRKKKRDYFTEEKRKFEKDHEERVAKVGTGGGGLCGRKRGVWWGGGGGGVGLAGGRVGVGCVEGGRGGEGGGKGGGKGAQAVRQIEI